MTEGLANTATDASDDIVRQRVDQALAREEAAAELIEVSFVHDARRSSSTTSVCTCVISWLKGSLRRGLRLGGAGLCDLRGRHCKNGRSPERGCCG